MQITISFDEIQAYQARVHEWAGKAVQFKSELLRDQLNPHRFPNHLEFLDEANRRFTEWEKANPFPQFLPKV
jgi:hypothetical protein